MNFEFAHPYFLIAIPILLVGFGLWFYFQYKKQYPTLTLSNTQSIKEKQALRGYFKPVLPVLRLLSLIFIVVALARPQTSNSKEEVSTYGIDIVVSVDISTSMLARDFEPNRLEASKVVANEFIENRPSDRFGLVVFAGESFTQCPLTTDHVVVREQMNKIENGFLEDGTAIGMGIATAVNRLKTSKAKSKVIILMTDGVNNRGFIDPKTATEIAKQYKVKIYTIGVGSNGMAYSPVAMLPNGQLQFGNTQVEIDEETLKTVAKNTGGKYFRANNNKSLRTIYQEIDQLEKTEIVASQITRKTEKFYLFLALALLFLFLELFLRYSLLKSIP